jgi:hypothetical protein
VRIRKKHTSSLEGTSYEGVAFFFVGIGIVLVVLHLILFYWDNLLLGLVSQETLQALGQFGEYNVSMIGAVWSLASIILFYEALKFQRNELKLQRHELELNRNELLEQTQQLRDQNKLMMIQNVENTYFQLLMFHNEILKDISYVVDKSDPLSAFEDKKIIGGRDSFIEYFHKFNFIYQNAIDDIGITSPTKDEMKGSINEAFNNFMYMYHSELSHYFRNVLNIIEFLDSSKLENKRFYRKLLIAQVSDYELILLFYYCLWDKGKLLKPLAEKYSIFINLNEMELFDKRHKDLFDEKAFIEV